MRRILTTLAVLWLSAAPAAAQLKVVASFSILGDFVAAVGGDDIALTVLVPAGGDAHAYQPRPADAVALAGADLVVINGFGFEGWIDRLVAASGYQGPVVRAAAAAVSQPISGASVDPHAWQDPRRARAYVHSIAASLASTDTAHAAGYARRAGDYLDKLARLDADIRAELAAIPAERRRVVTAHDAFGYFAAAYDIEFRAPQGLGAEPEPSAGAVATLIRQIRAENIAAVFIESVRNPRLVAQIARETGAIVAGPLYADSLSHPDGPAATYLDLMRHNAHLLAEAMAAANR